MLGRISQQHQPITAILCPSSSRLVGAAGRVHRLTGDGSSFLRLPCALGLPRPCSHRRRHSCRSTGQQQTITSSSEQSSSNGEERKVEGESRLKRTLLGLDALLGVEEEEKKEDKPEAPKLSIDVSPQVLEQLAAAESARVGAARQSDKPDAAKSSAEDPQGLTDQMNKIVEQARKLAGDKADDSVGEQALRKEFESLLSMLKPEDAINKDDLKLMKEKVFGPTTFWVTETQPMGDVEQGLLVRGNLRGEQGAVFEQVCESMQSLFGDKYTVFLIEDPMAVLELGGDDDDNSRPAFQITLTTNALPRPSQGWQLVSAVVLLLLTVGSSLQVGLVANLAKLPKETLDWLSNPDNVNSDMLPPGLEAWDPTPYIATALPIAIGVFGVATAREVGMRAAAGLKGVKMGPAYFIPNGQIGSFFSSTQVKSLMRNRTDLFDIAFWGAAMAGGTALSLFVAGLVYTSLGDLPKELLVPVPSQLFQGSLLLGFASKLGLGEAVLRSSTVYVHPYLVAGWCGLVATALNCLPVGSVDGGRMMQAAFGRGSLALSGFFSYLGLGLGFLGSSLSLPFGLYVLICQRTAEQYVQDNLSPVSDGRRTAAAVAVLAAILVLLPMAPELADTVGVGPQSPFL